MKRVIYILSLVLLFACDSETAGDCFQKTGNIIKQEVALDSFDEILVNRDRKLFRIENLHFNTT